MIRNKRVLGLINLMEDDSKLSPLTKNRPTAAIPFGGRYRVIDFVLSNMTASGIDTVGIYLNDKERSLMDHIKSGKPWDLDRMQGGIFYFTPSSTKNMVTEIRGDINTFYNNIDILSKSNCEYVLLSGSNMILNIDYNKVLEKHIESNADVTVVYKCYPNEKNYYEDANIIQMNKNGRITSFGKKIKNHQNQSGQGKEKEKDKVSLEMYILKTSLFIEFIEEAMNSGKSVFVSEILRENAKIYNYKGYEFKAFIGFISNIQNYFETSLDLINDDHLTDVFYGPSKINTKLRNENPAYYSPESKVKNSLVANGCEIHGEVENCILFRRVTVEKGAKLKNCILMQNTVVKSNVKLENVITDKSVIINDGVTLKGLFENPLVVEKEKVLNKDK